jgi:hypothetical protein
MGFGTKHSHTFVRAAAAAAAAAAFIAQAAAAVQITKKEEQELLERIRQEFGAKHVVRVCSMFECEKVLEGARRLLEHAPAIKESVDLRGASLAIDDCYEVWGSGFISIPYDFTLQELQPQLVKLLASSSSANGNGAGSGVPAGQQQTRPMAAARGVGAAGDSSHGLCSSYALGGKQHAGWALAGLPRVAPGQQQRQRSRTPHTPRACSGGRSSSSSSSAVGALRRIGSSPSLHGSSRLGSGSAAKGLSPLRL